MRSKEELIESAKLLAGLIGVLVVVDILDWLSGGYLMTFGLMPRDLGGLTGIAAAPFLHGDLSHLINNLIGLSVFGFLCLLKGIRYFIVASILIVLMTGALVWLFGREAYHVGASGWIFGLWSMVIAHAWFERSARSIAIAIGVIFFYGGMAYGVLPTQPFVSFESHLFGAISGVTVAWLLHNRPELASDSG